MITLTKIINPESFAIIVFLVFKLLRRKTFVYKQKRHYVKKKATF